MKRWLLHKLTLIQYGLMIMGRWIRRRFDKRYDSECRRRIREYKNEQWKAKQWD